MLPAFESTAALIRAAAELFAEETPAAVAVLERYGAEPHEREPDRVRFAILRLSAGQMDMLRYYTERAKQDYRDVLYWADCPPE